MVFAGRRILTNFKEGDRYGCRGTGETIVTLVFIEEQELPSVLKTELQEVNNVCATRQSVSRSSRSPPSPVPPPHNRSAFYG